MQASRPLILGLVAVCWAAAPAPGSAGRLGEGIDPETLFAQPSASAPPPVAHYYYYFKERRPLTVKPAQLAVFHLAGGDPGEISDLLAAAGHPDAHAQPLGFKGWAIFMLPAASATAAVGTASGPEDQISDLILDLLALDLEQRFFLSPVYGGSGPGYAIIMPSVAVRFVNGVTESQVEALLTAVGVTDLLRTYGGLGNSVRIHGHLRSSFHVLAIANGLAPMDEVVFAEPGAIISGGGGGVGASPGNVPNIPVSSPLGYAIFVLLLSSAGLLLLRR